MKDKNVELIVLLAGNFVPFLIKETDKQIYQDSLVNAVKDKEGRKEPTFYIQIGNACIFVNHIVGWYFRDPPPNQAEKLMDFIDKKLPDDNNGNEWKKDE